MPFTPGPWEVKPPAWKRNGPPYKTAIVAASGVIANVLTHSPRIRFEGDAMAGTLREIPIPPSPDAILIACAPELLEVCKDAIRTAYESEMGADWVAQMKRVVAKAEGKPSIDPGAL